MSVLIRFRINPDSLSRPTYEQIASKLAAVGRGGGDEYPEFLVWGNPSFPDATVIEYFRTENLAGALDGVRRAINQAGVAQYCTGGDLHLPSEPLT